MTDQTSADQAAAKPWTADEIAAMFMTNKGHEKKSAPVTIGLLVTLAEAYLAQQQEIAELRRALEDERAARRASVNVAVKTKLGSGRKP